MNTRAILAIVRKDLKVAVQNKGVLLPMIILPLILFAAMPWLMAYGPDLAKATNTSFSNIERIHTRSTVDRLYSHVYAGADVPHYAVDGFIHPCGG